MNEKAANTPLNEMQKEQLGKRDYILLIDKSGSMAEKDCPGNMSRWLYTQEQTISLARKCAEFDENGITLAFFDDKWHFEENVPGVEDTIKALFAKHEPSGRTNTAGVLNEVLQQYIKNRKTAGSKPITVICVTDGEPNDKQKVRDVIIEATKAIEDDNEIGISFVQVGKDGDARAFLKELDDNLQDEGAVYDIVDTVNDEEMENMTLTQILINAVCD